jgi:hypothetical protein
VRGESWERQAPRWNNRVLSAGGAKARGSGFSRGQNLARAVPPELGFTRVRHFRMAEVGYIRLRLRQRFSGRCCPPYEPALFGRGGQQAGHEHDECPGQPKQLGRNHGDHGAPANGNGSRRVIALTFLVAGSAFLVHPRGLKFHRLPRRAVVSQKSLIIRRPFPPDFEPCGLFARLILWSAKRRPTGGGNE